VLDLASGLMVLKSGSTTDDLIANRLTLHLLAGYSIGRVEFGAHLPVALWQKTDFSLLLDQGVTGPLVAPIASTALGDLRLGAKVLLLDGASWPLDLAALADLRLPTGNPDAFMSDGLALATSLVGSRRFGSFRLDGQLGYLFRGTGQYAQLVVHDGANAGLGGSLDLPPLKQLARGKAIADVLTAKTVSACRALGVRHVVLGGGVAANSRLRAMAEERCEAAGVTLRVPRPGLCTDNGAMVAALGARLLSAGVPASDLGFATTSNLAVTRTSW